MSVLDIFCCCTSSALQRCEYFHEPSIHHTEENCAMPLPHRGATLNLSDMEVPANHPSPPQPLKSFDYGVWRVIYENSVNKPSSWLQDTWTYIQTLRDAPVARFFRDVYAVDPYRLTICLLSRSFSGTEKSMLMYLSAKLLSQVSRL